MRLQLLFALLVVLIAYPTCTISCGEKGNTNKEKEDKVTQTEVEESKQDEVEQNKDNLMENANSIKGEKNIIQEEYIIDKVKYSSQVIARIGEDAGVRKAAEFLLNKHSTVTDYNLEYAYNPEKLVDEFKGFNGKTSDIKWENTKIQIVGHGSLEKGIMRVGGKTATELAKYILEMTDGKALIIEKISIVNCMPDGVEKSSNLVESYLEGFMKEMKSLSMRVETEVTIRSSLVAISSTGEKLTGRVTLEPNPDGSTEPRGIEWRSNDRFLKLVGKYTNDNKVKIDKFDVTDSRGKTETSYVGLLGKDDKLYIKSNDKSFEVNNKDIFSMLDSSAKNIVFKEKNTASTRQMKTYDVTIYNHKEKKFTDETKELREITSTSDLVTEIVHQSQKFNLRTSAKEEYYRFGKFVVKMNFDDLYVKVVGLVEPNSLANNGNNNELNKIKNMFTDFDQSYFKMNKKTGPDFFDDIKNWINGENHEIKLTQSNFNEHVYNAQTGMAMFLSESIRCTHNHITNMMALDLVEAHVLNKDLFFAKNINPMAQPDTWKFKLTTGAMLLNEMKNNPITSDTAEGIKDRLVRIAKSWLSHADTNKIIGSQNEPPESKFTIPTNDNFHKYGKKLFIELATAKLGSKHVLRNYEQKISDKLLSTQLSIPEIGSIKTQDICLSKTKDISGALQASLAIASDHEKVSKLISKAIQDREIKVSKNLEMISGSERIEGKYITFSVCEKENPSHTEEVMATVDESELFSKNILEDLNEIASDTTNKLSPDYGTATINRGLSIFGVVQGFKGALGKFGSGDYAEGTVYLAQSMHGLGDLTGHNMKIWQASKNLLKNALKEPMKKLSQSAITVDAERTMRSEVSSVIGEVNLDYFDEIPVLGTAFAIYNIAEDFKSHSTIGYIDAGLDALTAGLAFAGPEIEPFVIALTIIRMTIDTFYNDISKELHDLPSDASLSQKVTAVFKGIGDAIVDLCGEFTLIGEIYSAIENSKKLNKQYQQQQQFLQGLRDFSNYYHVVSGSGSSQINFGEGSLSLYGGGINFKLGESGTSQLTIEILDSDNKDRSITKIIDTKDVQDITMGIGESYSFNFKKDNVKFLMCIPVDTKWIISGNTTDRHSRHGQYTGNSKDNGFYAIQNAPSNAHFDFKLSEYNYHLYGGDGNDFFYLGPQITYVEGNEGSDTYYITSNTTITTIFNYAKDNKADYLILYLNFKDIKGKRQGQDAVFTNTDKSDRHLVKIKYWFIGEAYQHLILKTQDGFVCTISATETDSHLELTPYAFDGKNIQAGVTFDGQEPTMSHVKVITGSSHDDLLYGNDLNNQINGHGGSDTLTGGNGRDLYVLTDNTDTHSVVNNYAKDKKMDLLSVCAQNKEDVQLVDSNQDLLIRSHSCKSEVKIENWFSDVHYRHLMLATADGEVLNISCSRDNLRLQLVTINMARQSERDVQLSLYLFAQDLSSPTTGQYNYQVKNSIDLSRNPDFTQVVAVTGSDHSDWIVGNKQNNYMSGGKGADFLYGKEGYDVYVIRQGDGLNTLFQKFHGDKHMDTILFDADYDDIELVKEELYFGLQAYKSQQQYLAVALSCLLDEEQESQNNYHLSASLQTCFNLNELYHVKTRDGVVFKLPNSEELPMVKIPILVDYSKTDKKLTPEFTEQLTQVQRFTGSSLYDTILGNALNNYIDPGEGGSYMEGRNGSDTYVIRSSYGTDNGIYNHALDYKLDTLLFLVPFSSISVKVNDLDVVLTSTDASSEVVVSLYNYGKGDTERHLVVVTQDGITLALPSNKNYFPVPIIINKSQMQTGQYLNLTANSIFSEVKTVYGSESFCNHLVGSKQKNTIVGGSKADLLEGLNGDDVLKGGAGNDKLYGGPGTDNLVGGLDNDTLIGGDGDDIIAPGLGFNIVYGGDGTDTVMYGESGGIEALLSDNVIYHPHDTVVDRVYEVENVFGTSHNDILEGDDQNNVLMGYNGDDQLYTGKRGTDILKGGNGADTYSWLRAVKAFTSDIRSTMIVNNYATDGKIDTVLYDITVQNRKQIGFEKSNNDLVIRKINQQYPVFYDNGPIILLQNWFHPKHPELYQHIRLKLAEEILDCNKLKAIGDEAAKREQHNKQITG